MRRDGGLANLMISRLANEGKGNTKRRLAAGFACLFFNEKPSP
jgi:hypothetical protein